MAAAIVEVDVKTLKIFSNNVIAALFPASHLSVDGAGRLRGRPGGLPVDEAQQIGVLLRTSELGSR